VANPYVSLAYIADTAHPVNVHCPATWADDRAEKQRVWTLFAGAPDPVGYDSSPQIIPILACSNSSPGGLPS
jgi:hypothetical protein